MFCILAGVLAMVLGYVVPTFLLPVLTDNVWIDVIPAVANDELRTVAVHVVRPGDRRSAC